jgi:N-acetylglutamate synthase-like GNAT family acetyltransferase
MELFQSSLAINYDTLFLPTAHAFVENLSILAGASGSERVQLQVALEEVLAYVIDQFPDHKFEHHINLKFSLQENSDLVLEITHEGPPIHQAFIPEFDVYDETTVDGLWYKIARSMVDQVEMEGLNKAGWLIRLTKKIKYRAFERRVVPVKAIDIGGHLETREATPEDAAQLVDLAYQTYRYSYLTDYYNPDYLRENLRAGLYDTTVVEDNGRIVGALSIKYSAGNPRVAELGAAMVIPEYRRTTAFSRLIKAMQRYHAENPQNLELLECHAVTSHTISQRTVTKIDARYRPFAILLNFFADPNFIAIENRAGAKESMLVFYNVHGRLTMPRLYAPRVHQPVLEGLLVSSGHSMEVVTDTLKPEAPGSSITCTINEPLQLASLHLAEFGVTWDDDLRKALLGVSMQKIDTVIVRIKADQPLPPNLEQRLADLNLLFSGLVLESLESPWLHYMLINQPIDFSLIQIHDAMSQKLLGHIRNRYDHVLLRSE